MKEEHNELFENKNNQDTVIEENQNTPDETDIFNVPLDDKLPKSDNNNEQNTSIPPKEKNSKKHRHYLMIKEKGNKKFKIIFISLIILIVNVIILFGIICALNRLNTNVYKNVYVLGQDISNFTSEQVVKLIEQKANTIKETFNIDIYQNDKDIYDVKADDIEYTIDVQKTSDIIMSFGRKDNFLIDNIKILSALMFKNEIIPEYIYTEDKLDNVIKNIDLTLEDRYFDDTYSIDEVKNILTIIKGKTGNSINYDKVKFDILNILKQFKSSNYNINVELKIPTDINIEEVYNKVKRNPEDAYIDLTTTPTKFVNEKNGYDLETSKLKEVLNIEKNKIEGTSIEFPLTVIVPKIKLSDITYTLYNDKLSGYTTYFDSSQKTRANNLRIALSYLNGVIVMPGEIFSYYNKIGETTYSKGYKDAATFKGGTVVYEVGGGICQTSSTLYNVALIANMEIIERHQHGLPVGYVPPSRDATVYGNVLDFKFKNTRNYPIKIITTYSESGNMNISIYGTKEKEEYDITLSSKILYYIPYTTKYTYDTFLDSGVTSIIVKGVNGYASEAYITKKLDGTLVSTISLSKDVYKAQQATVKIGTKVSINNDINIY
ncbi:MAG: VanW family protein [Clostridia bacterium]|nr:VanW family protein [Clostridia bacterium]MDD4386244.1 VanW family protein [Clostridia bacterium]